MPVALAAVVTLGLGVRMLIEERFLTQTYPEYANYMKTAKRLIPAGEPLATERAPRGVQPPRYFIPSTCSANWLMATSVPS